MLVLLLAGCASSSTGAGPDTPPRPVAVPRHSPALTARVVLPATTMVAGSSMTAQVLVTNSTGQAIHVTGCQVLFQIALTSSTYQPVVAWAACAQRLTIPAGQTSYRVTLSASYSECGQGGPQDHLRACLPGGHLPPLAPGTYHARLFQALRLVRIPPPVTVRVTPPGHTRG